MGMNWERGRKENLSIRSGSDWVGSGSSEPMPPREPRPFPIRTTSRRTVLGTKPRYLCKGGNYWAGDHSIGCPPRKGRPSSGALRPGISKPSAEEYSRQLQKQLSELGNFVRSLPVNTKVDHKATALHRENTRTLIRALQE